MFKVDLVGWSAPCDLPLTWRCWHHVGTNVEYMAFWTIQVNHGVVCWIIYISKLIHDHTLGHLTHSRNTERPWSHWTVTYIFTQPIRPTLSLQFLGCGVGPQFEAVPQFKACSLEATCRWWHDLESLLFWYNLVPHHPQTIFWKTWPLFPYKGHHWCLPHSTDLTRRQPIYSTWYLVG